VTDQSSTSLSLVCALCEVRDRADAAERLARHFGATSLKVFVLDAQLGILVAAQGFSSVLPTGDVWAAFLSKCREPGRYRGEVPDGEAGRLVPATAYVEQGRTVVIFVGAHLSVEPEDFGMPILAALFRAEQRAWAAEGQAAASTEASRHAHALTAALDRSRGDIERAVQAKQQLLKDYEMLLGIVGHDLRNPLNTVVMGTSVLISRGDLPLGHLKTLQRIKATSQRMARMIADLLDFERSREGAIPISRTNIALRDVVTQVVEEIEVSSPTRVIELTVQGEGEGAWDADRLAQIVSNLVGNALQHSPPDTAVIVCLREAADTVALEVSNVHKSPISEDDLKHIFEPFRRGKESTGLGLGLYIVQQIANVNGHQKLTHLGHEDLTHPGGPERVALTS